MHMTKRPGNIIPSSTIEDLPKRECMPKEPIEVMSFRIKHELAIKLRDKTTEWGYSQQEIVNKALEAFLK